MDQLEKLWSELGRGAELKEQLLTDALGKAKRYGRTCLRFIIVICHRIGHGCTRKININPVARLAEAYTQKRPTAHGHEKTFRFVHFSNIPVFY